MTVTPPSSLVADNVIAVRSGVDVDPASAVNLTALFVTSIACNSVLNSFLHFVRIQDCKALFNLEHDAIAPTLTRTR
jgi:hypothetical protein